MVVSMRIMSNKLKLLYKQCTLQEISGGLGDLGTLLPLLIALSSQRSISLAPALFFGGLSNLITGLSWDVPMCVQPMKSIAAVALSEGWNEGTVTAAGILAGVFTLLLGITSLIEIVNKIIPGSVVSGLQIGVGVRLASKGINMVASLSWVDDYDCVLLAIICSILCLYWFREPTEKHNTNNSDIAEEEALWQKLTCRKRMSCNHIHPVGVYLFLIGAVFASITLSTTSNEPLRLFGAPIVILAVRDVTMKDWSTGLLEGALPQLPLTTLNSVIAVCALAHTLYPEKRRQDASTSSTDAVISRKEVAISVGLMNILFCPFGGMPNCHGAGGLAGQHRLGARHGSSVVFLGICKMFLAIFFGASTLTLLDSFPESVLGVMLVIAGHELATQGFLVLVRMNNDESFSTDEEESRKQKARALREHTVISLTTAIVIISIGKTHYGALSGFVAHIVYADGCHQCYSWLKGMSANENMHHGEDSDVLSTSPESRLDDSTKIQFPIPFQERSIPATEHSAFSEKDV